MMAKASDDSELPGFTLSVKDTENAAVSIWFTHNKNLLHGGHFTIGGLMNERYER